MTERASPGQGSGGFADAFGRLFGVAYRVAYRVLGDRGDAEDVAQEACARAAVRWERLAAHPDGWVLHVAANLAIDRYRRRRRPLPDPWAGYSGADADTVERLDLAHALRHLPRRQRQVAVLRYLADWSERDVARELGCSVGTVKSTGARALAALRRRLDEQGAIDELTGPATSSTPPADDPFPARAELVRVQEPLRALDTTSEAPARGWDDVPAS